jgi:hypothetical protein
LIIEGGKTPGRLAEATITCSKRSRAAGPRTVAIAPMSQIIKASG